MAGAFEAEDRTRECAERRGGDGSVMEYFFDELTAAQEAGSLDDAEHRRISLKYGIEWLE